MRKPVSNTQALLNARLWLKGLNDALAILDVKPKVLTHQGPGGKFHVVEAEMHHKGVLYRSRSNVDSDHLEVMKVGYYAYGKAIGRNLREELAECICKNQPQEITISLKDLDKAQTADRKDEAGEQAVRDFAQELIKMSQAGVLPDFKQPIRRFRQSDF